MTKATTSTETEVQPTVQYLKVILNCSQNRTNISEVSQHEREITLMHKKYY